jgi:hypothetical protein
MVNGQCESKESPVKMITWKSLIGATSPTMPLMGPTWNMLTRMKLYSMSPGKSLSLTPKIYEGEKEIQSFKSLAAEV